ncbi:Protease HtpX [Roseimaritima multifibrata]|uniref:Protease HtpX n=1 Tax=Roseimaritima multifibrata TaxID=1930274 RepID=A0A517MGQ3_9BACT|nr:M48 family metalloprotease [Roseimaritima multifibrata]QDS94068.1 Protease HtpX [Roseimaritima multifibrata]
MPLFWFLLVVVSLGCGSVPGNVVPAQQAMIASFGVLLAWGLLAKVAAYTTTRQMQEGVAEPAVIVREFERQITFLRWGGLVAAVMTLIGFGLANLIENLPVCEHSMAIRAILMITPAVMMVSIVWWADHQFGVANGWVKEGPSSMIRELVSYFRLQGAWLVVPVLALLTLVDLVALIPGISSISGGLGVAVLAILFIPLAMPWLAKRVWETEPIGDRSEGWLLGVSKACGFRRLDVRRWNTNHRSGNALVAGFVPGCRVLMITDRLLDTLSDRDLMMVTLHELAHLKRWHVPLRMFAVVPAWVVVWMVDRYLDSYAWSETFGVVTALAGSLGFLHLISYRTEFDADAYACRLAVKASATVPQAPRDLSSAAFAMAHALESVTEGEASAQRGSWLHPSIAKRQKALARLAGRDAVIENCHPELNKCL